MNLALVHCWKEWRAQRGILVAYTLLVFLCLCLGLLLAPTHVWFDEGFGVHALSWFVAAGVIGVCGFVAPALVRAEFGSKDDQFVRRLPGALWPSFRGKLLFLLLAALALPLLGLLVGEVFVTLRGYDWNRLFVWDWDGGVSLKWPPVVLGCGGALLLVPWVWAIGTWLPGGRMAVGGMAAFVLLVGVAVFAVLRQSPGLHRGIAWQGWLWAVAPLGLLVAAVSWGYGRRGGGPLRSARFGLAVTAAGLLPPSAWLAERSWAYHHPDLLQLGYLGVLAVSPDGTEALAQGAEHYGYQPVSLRIDLQTGTAERLAGVGTHLDREFHLLRPGAQQRYWFVYESGAEMQRVYDFATAQWLPVGYDEREQVPLLPTALREQVLAAVREHAPLRSPDGRRVWLAGNVLCREGDDGAVVQQAFPRCWLRPAGHGFAAFGQQEAHYDVRGRNVLAKKERRHDSAAWIVRDTVVFQPAGNKPGAWSQRTSGGTAKPCELLAGCSVLGLFDDDHLLCAKWGGAKDQARRLFLYAPADGQAAELRVPDGVAGNWLRCESPRDAHGSWLPRDPAGCIWLCTQHKGDEVYLRVDPATRVVSRAFVRPRGVGSSYRLLGWPDADHVLVSQDRQILRIAIATGERTVLFPRRQR